MITRISSVALLLVVCILLACDTAIHMAQAKDEAAAQTLEAHQYTLINSQGTVSGEMLNVDGKYPAVRLFDSGGKERIEVAISASDQPSISILDKNGQHAVNLTEDRTGAHILVAQPGRGSITVSALADGNSDILIRGSGGGGENDLALACTAGGTPRMTLSEFGGSVRTVYTPSGTKTYN